MGWVGDSEGLFLPRVRVTRVGRRGRGLRIAAAGASKPGVAQRRASTVVVTS